MILLLDIGNTRVKWGVWFAGVWRDRGNLALDEVESLAEVLARYRPRWVGASCVAGESVRNRVDALFGSTPRHWLVAAAEAHGIVNRYASPEALGSDRYAGLVACLRLGHAPCVVACAGTALTVDALAGNGEFLGGMILPGAALMRQALSDGTAGVSVTSGGWQRFPRATGDAVATGIVAAMAGAVEAMRRTLAEQLGSEVAVVMAGGDADILMEHLADPVRIERNLVLEGLLWLARDLGVSGA